MLDNLVLADASDALLERAASLRAANFSAPVVKSFTFGQLKSNLEKDAIKTWLHDAFEGKKPLSSIYRISVDSIDAASLLIDAFDAEKLSTSFALPRKNKVPVNQTVYVGSSRSICNRLFQHLVHGPQRTYALHLAEWCPPGPHQLRVEVQAPIDQMPQELVQIAEDALWDRYQPMFGRRGAR
jgi:hypothetical protein